MILILKKGLFLVQLKSEIVFNALRGITVIGTHISTDTPYGKKCYSIWLEILNGKWFSVELKVNLDIFYFLYYSISKVDEISIKIWKYSPCTVRSPKFIYAVSFNWPAKNITKFRFTIWKKVEIYYSQCCFSSLKKIHQSENETLPSIIM